MYNFQVEAFHTYYVGENGVLVHNAEYISSKTPKDISEMTRKQLKENTPENWDFQEHNGRIHIKDNNGNYRVRVDVPDKHTPYNHIHILDENGNPLDINGNIVSPKDPAGHIPYKY